VAPPGQSTLGAVEQGRVLRSAGTVGAITLLSRVSGYARDMVFAYLLGTGLAADAFVAAFRLPNMLRRVVGEGNVSAAFVPVFEHEACERSDENLWKLADSFHANIVIFATFLTIVGIAAAPWIVRNLLVPGFGERPGAWELTSDLARLTFPYLIFIAAAAVLMAVLNAKDRFAAPAVTPVLFNLTLITVGLAFRNAAQPVYAWATAAVAGGLLQWAFQVPFAWRLGMRFRWRLNLGDPALRKIGALMVPGVFGVGITQINVLVGQYLASGLAQGSIASLYLAGRLNELTLGVFAISVATVVLPLMSRQAAAGRPQQMLDTMNFALRQVTLITLPAAVGLVMLRTQLVQVLFQRGSFDAASTEMTAAALWGYSIGLVGYAAVRIVAPGFFTLKDTRTPVIVGAVALAVNVVGCLLLMRVWGHAGIALANSIAAYVNLALLLVLLRRRVGPIGGRRLLASVTRLALAAVIMGWVVYGLADRWWPGDAASFWWQACVLAGLIFVGVLTYAAGAAVLRAPELSEMRTMVTHKSIVEGDAPTLPENEVDPE
jgi:putative peptidoglycan lipid II flippase